MRGGAIRRLATRGQRDPADRQRSGRADQDGGPTDRPRTRYYNAAFLVKPDGTRRRRLSQDAPGAVRRVRAAQAAAVLRRPARRGGRRLLAVTAAPSRCCCRSAAIMASTAICYEVVYPNLIRAVRRRRQRAADDDHQRRLVRAVVGAVSALRAGRRCARSRTAATWCAPPTPASAASSIRTAACSRSARLFEPAILVAGSAVPDRIARSTAGSAISSRGCRWRSRVAALLVAGQG